MTLRYLITVELSMLEYYYFPRSRLAPRPPIFRVLTYSQAEGGRNAFIVFKIARICHDSRRLLGKSGRNVKRERLLRRRGLCNTKKTLT